LGVIDGREDAPVVRRGALLLFGKPESAQRFVPTHEIAFQVIDGTAVEWMLRLENSRWSTHSSMIRD